MMMPCGTPLARSLSLVWVMISRRCATHEHTASTFGDRLDDGRADHRLARSGRGHEHDALLAGGDFTIEVCNHRVLIGAQVHDVTPARLRGCAKPARRTARDGAFDTGRAIVRVAHQPVGGGGLDQPVANFGAIELATRDELEQRERCAVERVIAGSRQGIGECGDLGFERGLAVGARQPNRSTRNCSLTDR